MDFHYAEPQNELEKLLGGHFHINLIGRVLPGDDEKFRLYLERTSPPPRTMVHINSTGGDVDAAIGIGRILRGAWFSTTIGSILLEPAQSNTSTAQRTHAHGVCYSAATLIYLGGKLRFLPTSFEFGVHQFSFQNPTPEHVAHSQVLSARIAAFLHDMGVSPKFVEVSSSTPGDELKLLDLSELKALGLITGGMTGVTWSSECRNKIMYIKGERDSIYGHHKVMLCFAKGAGFQFWSLIEAQGRERELIEFGLVEIVLNGESERIDISDRCLRSVSGKYVSVFSRLSEEEARRIAFSESFGVQIRFWSESDVFLGISAMNTNDGSDILTTFFENLSS